MRCVGCSVVFGVGSVLGSEILAGLPALLAENLVAEAVGGAAPGGVVWVARELGAPVCSLMLDGEDLDCHNIYLLGALSPISRCPVNFTNF